MIILALMCIVFLALSVTLFVYSNIIVRTFVCVIVPEIVRFRVRAQMGPSGDRPCTVFRLMLLVRARTSLYHRRSPQRTRWTVGTLTQAMTQVQSNLYVRRLCSIKCTTHVRCASLKNVLNIASPIEPRPIFVLCHWGLLRIALRTYCAERIHCKMSVYPFFTQFLIQDNYIVSTHTYSTPFLKQRQLQLTPLPLLYTDTMDM